MWGGEIGETQGETQGELKTSPAVFKSLSPAIGSPSPPTRPAASALVGEDMPRPAGTRCPRVGRYSSSLPFSEEKGRRDREGICKGRTGKREGGA